MAELKFAAPTSSVKECMDRKLAAKGGEPSDQDLAIVRSECERETEKRESLQETQVRDCLEFRITPDQVASNVIERVKILGPRSVNKDENGRPFVYTEAARNAAVSLYEGIAVNLDHPPRDRPNAERSYRDRIGRLEGIRNTEGGLVADRMVLNPKHPLFEQIIWDAQHSPESLGLSHNARGMGRVKGDQHLIETITSVRSVDIVADPATTRSLFESEARMTETKTTETETTETEANVVDVVESACNCKADDGALVEARKEIDTLRARVDELETLRKAEDRRKARETALAESKLPADAVSETFRRSLMEANDEQAKELIEDRKALWFGSRPVSRDPGNPVETLESVDDFVAALRKG